MNRRRLLLTALSLASLGGLWNVAGQLGLLPFFPTMPRVAAALLDDVPELMDGATATTARALFGLGIGAGLGVVAGLWLAWSRTVAALAEPYVIVMKSVPGMALIPLFILWFGLAEAARIAFVATLCFFIVLIAAAEAIPNVPRVYRWAAATLGASNRDVYIHVVLPAMLPNLFGGLRNATTVSFAIAVAAEFIGAQSGLGWYITHVSINYRMDQMVAGVLAITLLAVTFDTILMVVQNRILSWAERR